MTASGSAQSSYPIMASREQGEELRLELARNIRELKNYSNGYILIVTSEDHES